MGFIRFETNKGFIFPIPAPVSRISRKNHYFYPMAREAIFAESWQVSCRLLGINNKQLLDSQILWIKIRKIFWV
jgi:hypothetical protein